MPVNWTLLHKTLTNYFSSPKLIPNPELTAQMISTQYELAIRQSSTIFGNTIISVNTPALYNALLTSFKMQESSPVSLGIGPYSVMGTGFMQFWIGATLLPFPPNPPSMLPLPIPMTVTFPGDIITLTKNLHFAFTEIPKLKTPSSCASYIITSLKIHLTTLQGLYYGQLLTPLGPIPLPPIPFVGLF